MVVWLLMAVIYQVCPPQKANITHNTCHFPLFPKGKVNLDVNKITLQRNNISHLGKRKIIDSKVPFCGHVLVPRRVSESFSSINLKVLRFMLFSFKLKVQPRCQDFKINTSSR